MGNEIVVRPPAGSVALPDNAQWTNRFEVRSESSNRLYVISRNRKSGKWGCSCPGYLRHRKCKHLTDGCGLSLSQIHGRDHLDNPTPNDPQPVRQTRALDDDTQAQRRRRW